MILKIKSVFLRRELLRRLKYFVCIGGIGFLIDGGLLSLLTEIAHLSPYISRSISFPIAVSVTWYLNRRITFFSNASIIKTTEYTRYFVIQIVGACINLGTFGLLLKYIPSFAIHPILPFSVGAFVAMIFNFLGAQYFVFRTRLN